MGLQCLRMFWGHISQGLINMRGVRVPPFLVGAGAGLRGISSTIAQRNRHLAGKASTHHHHSPPVPTTTPLLWGRTQDLHGQSLAPLVVLSDTWKGTTMTNQIAMDINTFCALPIWIPTIQHYRQKPWFILNIPLRTALELPEGFDHEEFLDLKDWSRDLHEYANGENAELLLVSESGLYQLILLSKAKMFSKFKNWVMQVVAPTIADDGLYWIGEESKYPAPTGYDLTHANIWDEDASDFGSARDLANRYLPELRRDTYCTDGIADLNDLIFAVGKKDKRRRTIAQAA